jgi:hypothetical protein
MHMARVVRNYMCVLFPLFLNPFLLLENFVELPADGLGVYSALLSPGILIIFCVVTDV